MGTLVRFRMACAVCFSCVIAGSLIGTYVTPLEGWGPFLLDVVLSLVVAFLASLVLLGYFTRARPS